MTENIRKKRRRIKRKAWLAILFVMGVPLGFFGAISYERLTHEDGYALFVEGEHYATLDSQTKFQDLIQIHTDHYKSSYRLPYDAKVEISQDIKIEKVRVLKGNFDSEESVLDKLSVLEEEAHIYTVEAGDNLWNIAIENEIPLSQIIKYNPSLDPDKIWPDDQIIFEPENPVLDVVVEYEQSLFEDVQYPTEYIQDASLYTSQRIVIQKGVYGKKEVTYQVGLVNGFEEERYVVQETQLVDPIKAIVKVGTKRTLVRTSTTNFGVTNGRLTSNYGYRVHPITGVRTFHAGIDIAAPTGTAIYAYTDGTVIDIGYDNYYGKYIMLSHGGGLVTIYKHLSSYNVSFGDKVKVGQKIGGMGSTGFSTGSHLHFEVRVNGTVKNPWDYI